MVRLLVLVIWAKAVCSNSINAIKNVKDRFLIGIKGFQFRKMRDWVSCFCKVKDVFSPRGKNQANYSSYSVDTRGIQKRGKITPISA
jgi:hypothetical protein